jgi:predicted RNA-binding Zn ribbon-like protein
MSTPSPSTSRPAEPAFEYVGGDPALDFVNTADWLAAGPANERLTNYERLIVWAAGAGIVTEHGAAALRRRAARASSEADAALAEARALRALLQRLFHEHAEAGLSPATCAQFDGRLAQTLARLGVEVGSPPGRRAAGVRWCWRGAEQRLDSVLWPVTRSAARLLTSDEAGRIRVCAGPDCGWVYVDRSRNHLRRWCQMKTCGTAAKTRRRRRRTAASP